MNYDKDEFFTKLKEWLICISKMDAMEKATGLDFDRAFDELIDTNVEYQRFSEKSMSLRADIDRLLISFKGYPLTKEYIRRFSTC